VNLEVCVLRVDIAEEGAVSGWRWVDRGCRRDLGCESLGGFSGFGREFGLIHLQVELLLTRCLLLCSAIIESSSTGHVLYL
jgi:hypothetical protein